MSNRLGVMQLVEVRDHWPSEAQDFTPWLAEEENLQLLGEALGIELELQDTEVSVGPYSADVLARDTGSDDYVVIENQLGKTNHDHLGKAITYGAALNAAAIVWIASDFSDEHKRGLDWLNDNSSGEVAYFGVRLELWQIDDSRPAVRFNVLSRPAEIVPVVTLGGSGKPISARKKLQGEFWSAFRTRLLEEKVLTSARKARPQYWYTVALGRSGIHLSTVANTTENWIGIRVYMRSKYNAEAALRQLMAQRESIESEIGVELDWDASGEARDKTIALKRSADLRKTNMWPDYLDWLADMTAKFRKAFMPRVKSLELEGSEEESSDEAELSLA